MTPVTINVKFANAAEVAKAKLALQKIADNASFSNLEFLAKLAAKPGINEKLENPLNRAALLLKL